MHVSRVYMSVSKAVSFLFLSYDGEILLLLLLSLSSLLLFGRLPFFADGRVMITAGN